MAVDMQALQLLLARKAQEGQYLEFKRGDALHNTSAAWQDLVKDCTGFANANGGTIVYGIAEERIDGVRVAAEVSPVVMPEIDADWITNVLRDNSSPPLSRFEVTELSVDGGVCYLLKSLQRARPTRASWTANTISEREEAQRLWWTFRSATS